MEKKYQNKYEDIVKSKYENYNEDERFNRKSQKVEFLTTMRYIKNYAKKGAKILELGAGTGRYSIELAKMGYDVTAVELVKNNLTVMKKNAKGIANIKCLQGDALDLSRFKDNTFDIVLNLGPMYHLFTEEDKHQAVNETLRVLKPKGICMFAYLTHGSITWAYGVRKGALENCAKQVDKNGKYPDIPEEIFTSYFIEDFHKLFENTNSKHLKNVATDGLFPMMREYIDDKISDKDYKFLLQQHFVTCERLDYQGYSSHMLYICQKN